MASVVKHYWPCIEVICESVNNKEKTTYGQLANKLGLSIPRQEWSDLLNLVANKCKRDLGDGDDLTWNVVYGNGPAKGLGLCVPKTSSVLIW